MKKTSSSNVSRVTLLSLQDNEHFQYQKLPIPRSHQLVKVIKAWPGQRRVIEYVEQDEIFTKKEIARSSFPKQPVTIFHSTHYDFQKIVT